MFLMVLPVREVADEQPHHSDANPASRDVARPVRFIGSNESGNDEVTCGHTNSSSKQDRLATEFVNVEQSRNSGEKFDHTDNTCC